MTPNEVNKKAIPLPENCNEMIQLQNELLSQIHSELTKIYMHGRECVIRDIEYESFLADYNNTLKRIQEQLKYQGNLKAEIGYIKEQLNQSTYERELEIHKFLQYILDRKSHKLTKKLKKKLNKEQIKEFQDKEKELEAEKGKNYRLKKINDELNGLKLENRELVAIAEQKTKRHDMLKKTYNETISRKEKLIKEKEKLARELEELEQTMDSTSDESF